VSASETVDLRSLTLEEATELVSELGQERYRGEQVFRWVHGWGAGSMDDLANLPAALRQRLSERAEIATLKVAELQTSADGTRKMRLTTGDGRSIESVLIPDGDKLTQCISSQVGCALDCQFCATATLGLARNLSAGEIVDQVYRAKQLLSRVEPGRRITNIVYMGMGEPLHNFAHVSKSLRILTHELGANLSFRRITVSTVGLVHGIEKLAKQDPRPNLAISLNATTDEVRDRIMPINKRYPIATLLDCLRRYPLEPRRRLTFEYVLLAGQNDTVADADRLARLLRGFRCKVNIIPFNPHPGAPYRRPEPSAVQTFQNRARSRGLPTYLRAPRGDDIAAACGQLANQSRTTLPVVMA